MGTLNWVWDGNKNPSEDTRLLVEGKYHGDWDFRYADGTVAEGPFVVGKRHGRCVWRFTDGTVEETNYIEGKEVDN